MKAPRESGKGWRKILSPGVWLPVLAFAVVAYIVFGWLLVPMRVQTADMAPTFTRGEVVFCCRPLHWFSKLKRHDLVVLKPPSGEGLLIRRVVAFPGEMLGFREGNIILNGGPLNQPYVENPGRWTMRPSRVPDGVVYVVGDNRAVPPEQALFGQVPRDDIVGRPIW
jgi:signal peptidase I